MEFGWVRGGGGFHLGVDAYVADCAGGGGLREVVVRAEGAAEGFADVGGAEGGREVEDWGQDEGGGVCRRGLGGGVIAEAVRAVGEGGGDGRRVGGRVGEGRLDRVLGDEGWAGEPGLGW